LYNFEQITPVNPSDRGSHLSIRFPFNAEYVLDQLKQEGVVCDFRAPDVIRVAPVALYTTFGDVYRFVDILQRCLNDSFSCSVSINII
jgi:kynureninase